MAETKAVLITGELCICGHGKDQHRSRMRLRRWSSSVYVAFGEGPCTACECQRFRFVKLRQEPIE